MITSRQTIQSIAKWVEYKKELIPFIVGSLTEIDILKFKPSGQKLIITDIIDIFLITQRLKKDDRAHEFICHALTGEMLGAKTRKRIIKQMDGGYNDQKRNN